MFKIFPPEGFVLGQILPQFGIQFFPLLLCVEERILKASEDLMGGIEKGAYVLDPGFIGRNDMIDDMPHIFRYGHCFFPSFCRKELLGEACLPPLLAG
jgi:hypothetical protein